MCDDFEEYAAEIDSGLDADRKPTLSFISAKALQRKNIPPLKSVVENLICSGVTFWASPPKFGKSWNLLDCCISVASGTRFLGYKTNKTEALYLALEDSERRLQSRMNKLLNGREAPEGLYYSTYANTLDEGLIDELETFVAEHPAVGLIVIDTLQKIRGNIRNKESAYGNDYREIGTLKAFADRHNIALVLVHHLRKMQDNDVFNQISGTTGLSGAADTMVVISKERRTSENATMSITGRDVEQRELTIHFNTETCKWENLGDADAYAEQQAQKEYLDSPLRKTILKLLDQGNGEWLGTMKDLLTAGQYIAHCSLADSSRGLTERIKKMENQLLECDGVGHNPKPNGTGGGKHKFYYINATVINGSNGSNDCNIWG